MLTPDQVYEILRIIEFNHIMYINSNIGTSVLSTNDKKILSDFGIDPSKISKKYGVADEAFHFGRLASALGQYKAKKMSYGDFKKMVYAGGYMPMSTVEHETLRFIKGTSYSAIKNLGNRIGSEVLKIVGDTGYKRRVLYEKIIRDESKKVAANRQSMTDMMLNIGHKTGDWERDLSRLVETEMHRAYENGRAADIKRRGGVDAKVYKDVYAGACKHCIRLFLSNGIGSEPIVFKLSEIMANGSNVGRKVADWKPTIDPVHPYCRCHLRYVPDGTEWDGDSKSFKAPKGYKTSRVYKVKVKIGNKEYSV